MIKIIISSSDASMRLDKYLFRILPLAPKGFIYRAFRKNIFKLNNVHPKGDELLAVGDRLQIYLSDDKLEEFGLKASLTDIGSEGKDNDNGNVSVIKNKAKTLADSNKFFSEIVYEDENILIVNKNRNIECQKSATCDFSLNEALLEIVGGKKGTFTPSVCNRLDKNTLGLVIFAKTYEAAKAISEGLRKRTIHKYYLAVIKGRMKGNGNLSGYLVKDRTNNKVCIYEDNSKGGDFVSTLYEDIGIYDEAKDISLLRLELITGKSHQIRASLESVGHPIVGDPKYGDSELNKYYKREYGISGQLLIAATITMPAFSGSLANISGRKFEAKVPEEFGKVLPYISLA